MNLLKIAWRNLQIRPIRMLFVLVGLATGVAVMVALVAMTTTMERQLTEHFEQVGSRVLITPGTQEVSLAYRGLSAGGSIISSAPLLDELELKELLQSLQGQMASGISSKLLATVAVMSEHDLKAHHALALGVDFPRELQMKPYWQVEGEWPNQQDQLLLGYHLAQRLGVAAGEALIIGEQLFAVKGVLAEIGTEEDVLIYMNLAKLQLLTNRPNQLSMIELSFAGQQAMNNQQNFLAFAHSSTPDLRVVAVKDAVSQRRDLVDRLATFTLMVGGVILIIGIMIIATTMINSVRERTREIGIFRAIGFRQSHILKIIYFEAAILSLGAGLGGYLLGMLVAWAALPNIHSTGGLIWDGQLLAGSLLLSLLVGLAASSYPAIKAASLDPIRALSYI